MKKIYVVFTIILLISCQPKKTQIENLKSAFTLLLKENASEEEVEKFYKFPFFNESKIYENPKELLEWRERRKTFIKEWIKIDNIEIIDSYTFTGVEKEHFKENKRYKDLKRILNLNKENSKILEVVYNKKRYLENGSSILVLYDTNSNKIFGFKN